MKQVILPYSIGRPPAALRKAKLDNIALVPASLLPFKTSYQATANKLPRGSVLCVPGTPRQQKIIEQVRRFFKTHGRSVITMSLEKITRKKPSPRPTAENLPLAF